MTMIAPAKPGKPVSEIERRILAPGDVDALGEAVLSLAREVWVLTDRQLVTERALADHGIDLRATIERYEPDEAFAAELGERRKRLIGELLRTLGTGIPDGVTHSAKFGD